MSQPANPLRRLALLSIPLSLPLVFVAWPFPADAQTASAQTAVQTTSPTAAQTTVQPTEIVIGGRVVARRVEAGRVVESERALTGATAELLEFRDLYRVLEQALPESKPPKPVATDRVDGRGFYELSAPTHGRWTLRLSAPGKATDERTLIAYLPWEEHSAVALAERREVQVQVLDPEGKPVAGARVVGWPEADDPHHIETGLTGDDGRLTMPAAAGSPLHLAAFAPGYAPAEEMDAEAGAAVLRLQPGLPRRVEVRQGRGLPAPDTLVLLGESGIPAGKTDDDGRLEIWAPAETPLTVRALAPDLRSASLLVEPVEPGEPEASEAPGVSKKPIRLDLEALPVVSGQVVDAEDRTPLAGVVLWAPDAGEGLTVSDRAGGFRLALPEVPRRDFRVMAILPGYVPRGFPVERERANGPLATLLLSPAAAVSGTVVDTAGEPVAEAEIQVVNRFFRSRGQARSGAQGRFLVPSISPGGSARLTVEKPGYAPAMLDIPLLEAGRTVEGLRVVLERGSSVAGQVVDAEDQPVSGAQIWLLPRGADSSPMARFSRFRLSVESADALSGSDGGFMVEHLAEGSYDLRVEASGYAPAEVPGIEIADGGSPVGEPLDLGTVVLDSAAKLVGQVVDPDGAPLAGVQVRAMSHSGRWGPPGVDSSQGVSDAEGRFSLGDFRNGESVTVSAKHPGYADTQVSNVQVPVPEPLEIVLQPAARIRGTVRDAEGRPVEDALVRVDKTARSWSFARPGDQRTDAEGRFTVTDVPPGEVTLLAWAEGYLRDAMVHLDVAPGAQLDGIELTLSPGATVFGQVTGPGGEPVPGARVSLLSQEFLGPSGGMEVTDGDGRYRIDGVSTGPQTLGARHGDHPPAVKDVEVRPGENRLDFRLETGSRVSGRVLEPGGGPVAGASVSLQPMTHSEHRRAISQSDGSFDLLGVPEGEYRVVGSHRSLGEVALEEPLTIRGADVTGIELQFQGGATIRGRVVGLSLDELASLDVRSYSNGGSGQWARPDYEGNFVLEDVAPGTWTILATSSGQRVAEEVEVPEGVSEVEVELEFRSGSVLAGRVLLGSEPMQQGSVAAHSTGTGSGGFGPLDHEGRFRIEGLEEGTYLLRIFGESGLQHQQEVEVPTDGEVLITLEPAQLRGRVVDAVTGDPLSGVSVSLLPQGDDSQRTRMMGRMFGALLTDSRGVFRVPEIAAGPYRLTLNKDGYSRTEMSITVDPGASEPVEVRLQPSQGLLLQLSWASGLIPSPWVQVTATGADGQIGLTDRLPVSAGGLVRLKSLPPGTWEIQVDAAGGSAKVQVVSPGPTVPVTVIPNEG